MCEVVRTLLKSIECVSDMDLHEDVAKTLAIALNTILKEGRQWILIR